MRVGVPTEIKEDENRVAITPAGVAAFRVHGHEVVVESGAGTGSHISDGAYRAAGANIVDDAADVWQQCDLILKVKEPLPSEYDLLRPGQVLFTYLHLAASDSLVRELLARKIVGIGYETVQLADGTLPLLVPMSEVAGRLSIQAGAKSLETIPGGKGILLPGVSGVRRGRITIIGAGVVGFNACVVAVGFGADVTIIDISPLRLSYVRDVVQGHVTTLMSNAANIEAAVREADLVIGAVLIAGAKTPTLIPRKLLRQMEPGSALVDVAVDQGGCAETTRPTSHHDPQYIEGGCRSLLRIEHAGGRSAHVHLCAHQRHARLRPGTCPAGLAPGGGPRPCPGQWGQCRRRTVDSPSGGGRAWDGVRAARSPLGPGLTVLIRSGSPATRNGETLAAASAGTENKYC